MIKCTLSLFLIMPVIELNKQWIELNKPGSISRCTFVSVIKNKKDGT